jgi:hypothetical protein
MNKINTQIVDVICVCMVCETPIRTLVLSTRLHEVALLCYDCQLTKLANKKKVGI